MSLESALLDAAPLPEAAPVDVRERAQAIDCAGVAIALPYGWARAVVEQVDLVDVPGAPTWLAGAANVDGAIVPVVDLAAWAWSDRFTDSGPGARLLLGGHGEDAYALLFRGLPGLVRFEPGAGAPGLPARLSGLAKGQGQWTDASGTTRRCSVLDPLRLFDSLVAELALP
jgi:chemotaxis signal transduction protein